MSAIPSDASLIAICYLEKENDKNNRCLLSEDFLTIVRKGRATTLDLKDIRYLSLESRKMMLPLIAGGAFSSLSVIAIAKGLFNPWGILIWLMINLSLFYFGWVGYHVLSIGLQGFHRDFPLRSRGKNLNAFIVFTNEFLESKRNNKILVSPIYHVVKARDWTEAQEKQSYAPASLQQEGFIHFATKKQLPVVLDRYFKGQKDLLLIQVDPLKVKAELKYEQVYDQENPYPHLYGPLNLDAVVKAELL